MAARKKAVAKKNSNVSQLPQSGSIPEGMKQMGGGYAQNWRPEEINYSIRGLVSAPVKELTLNKGTKKENDTRVMELTTEDGEKFAVWESATLVELFDTVAAFENPIGFDVFIRYQGLGKKKPGQNPPRLYEVATMAVEDFEDMPF